jgi:hypothetical protein
MCVSDAPSENVFHDHARWYTCSESLPLEAIEAGFKTRIGAGVRKARITFSESCRLPAERIGARLCLGP